MSHCWFPVKNELQRNSFAQVSKLEASLVDLDSFHTTPEEFEYGGFALETHQMFFVHTTLEGFKNATITAYFGFVFEENSVREIT